MFDPKSRISPGVTLPRTAYSDPSLFQQEQDHIFANSWIYVGHIAQVKAPGSYLTATVAGEPIMVLRDQDGQLRALSRVCRHRAAVLVEGQGRCDRVLECPYHGWSYQLDGKLAAATQAGAFGGVDLKRIRLPEYRLDVLSGLIFVSLKQDIEPAEDWFGALGSRLRQFPLESLQVRQFPDEWHPQNWKVMVDNFLEGYHVPAGHPGLYRLLDIKRYLNYPGRHHVWIEAPLQDRLSTQLHERLYQRLVRPMPGYPEGSSRTWYYAFLWPSTFIDIYPDQLDVWHLHPTEHRMTRSISTVFVPQTGGLRQELAIRLNHRINRVVQAEDNFLCARVQQGLEGRSYTRGVLNGSENAVAHFHQLMRAFLPAIDPDMGQSNS